MDGEGFFSRGGARPKISVIILFHYGYGKIWECDFYFAQPLPRRFDHFSGAGPPGCFMRPGTPSPWGGASNPGCKPISFPSLSNKLLPSEAGGGSGTGRGGGRWFQRRRQDDPQEEASLLCWMNIHTWRNVWATFEMLICLYVTIINKTWRFCPEKFSLCPCRRFRQPCFSEACHQKACQHIFSEGCHLTKLWQVL